MGMKTIHVLKPDPLNNDSNCDFLPMPPDTTSESFSQDELTEILFDDFGSQSTDFGWLDGCRSVSTCCQPTLSKTVPTATTDPITATDIIHTYQHLQDQVIQNAARAVLLTFPSPTAKPK